MTLSVRVYHNTTTWLRDGQFIKGRSILGGYLDGDELTHVADIDVQPRSEIRMALEEVYKILNVGDDPDFGPVNPQAVEYRRRKNRSLSVGDVMVIDGIAFAVAQMGLEVVTVRPEQVTNKTTHGTTPLGVA